jgi:CRP-like cAMP-binding protein
LRHNPAVADARAVLRGIPLFSALPDDAIAKLFSLSRPLSVRARAVVVDKGDPGAHLFAVLAGRLKVITPGEATGTDASFTILGPGDVLGEIALLDGLARSARVTALEPCHLIVIDRGPFLEFLRSSPELAISMLQALAQRVRLLSERIEDEAFLDVPSRLAKRLLKLAERHGEPMGGGVCIPLRLSQHELGELIGATRESVNKHLRAWQRRRIVARDGGRLVVRNVAALRALAGGR